MTDLGEILQLWRELRSNASEYVLATVVAVEGSGYRKPGARMIIASDGRRRGTISGGCLEGEVARKAFWHTEHGPVVRRYSTSAEDGDVPFGMGCGGVVHLLLERDSTAATVLERLENAFEFRQPLAIATVLEGEWIATRAFWPERERGKTRVPLGEREEGREAIERELAVTASKANQAKQSFGTSVLSCDGTVTAVSAEWNNARPGLFIFGAGDDAVPVVRLAHQLGWYVVVADGRSNLVTKARFPEADETILLNGQEEIDADMLPTDAAAVMTHSLEQDTNSLRGLLKKQLAYVGVLGPRRRTTEILTTLAYQSALLMNQDPQDLANRWLDQIHTPMGLDLGGETPADIALAIVSEVQRVMRRGSGLALRSVRQGRHLEQIA